MIEKEMITLEISKVSHNSLTNNGLMVEEKDPNLMKIDRHIKEDSLQDQVYSEKELKEAAEIINTLLQKHDSHVEYTMHEKFRNVIMIKIVDSKTDEVLQEIPPKKIMDMVAKMCEIVGIMVDEKV